jgi:hypothetical protein
MKRLNWLKIGALVLLSFLLARRTLRGVQSCQTFLTSLPRCSLPMSTLISSTTDLPPRAQLARAAIPSSRSS